MNKSELVGVVAGRLDVPKKRVESAVDLVFDYMIDAMRRENRIEIRGFGSFTIKHYEPYLGRNPRTGEKINVRAKRLPFFKVGKELKKRVDFLGGQLEDTVPL